MGPIVVLVGPPGAGKSTVGRLVAARLGVAFRDTDDDVEAASGTSVSEVYTVVNALEAIGHLEFQGAAKPRGLSS